MARSERTVQAGSRDRSTCQLRGSRRALTRLVLTAAGIAACLLPSCRKPAQTAAHDDAFHWCILRAPAGSAAGDGTDSDRWLFYFGPPNDYDRTGIELRKLWTAMSAINGQAEVPLAIVHHEQGAPQTHIDMLLLCLEALGAQEIRIVPALAGTPQPPPWYPSRPTRPAPCDRPAEERVADVLAHTVQAQIARMLSDHPNAGIAAKLAPEVTAGLRDALSAAARSIAEKPSSAPELLDAWRAAHREVRIRTIAAIRQRRQESGPPGARLDLLERRLRAGAVTVQARGRDIAWMTADGLPAFMPEFDAFLCGALTGSLPVITRLVPGHVTDGRVHPGPTDLRPVWPPPPRQWGFVQQPQVKPHFQSPRFEGIPFFPNPPRLDGDLSDWGAIRPLVLQHGGGYDGAPLRLWAGWNYQGFFCGYQVQREGGAPKFQLPSDPSAAAIRQGDYLRLTFDTLNSRAGALQGWSEQEFLILPNGAPQNRAVPGAWRTAAPPGQPGNGGAKRAWGQYKAFPPQPPTDQGPDGTGPYRVTRMTAHGYTMEVFIPRSLLKVPAFCPGWVVGFDCAVAVGAQRNAGRELKGGVWVKAGDPDAPGTWGDLLLMGTDPHFVVQDASKAGPVSVAVIPGHSCLVTVVDPDRNVDPKATDMVTVVAEVLGAETPGGNDVEAFILHETGANTSVFRGYINTQPGPGGNMVLGLIELRPGQELKLAYPDFADAAGRRNAAAVLRLPVARAVVGPAKSDVGGN